MFGSVILFIIPDYHNTQNMKKYLRVGIIWKQREVCSSSRLKDNIITFRRLDVKSGKTF